MLILINSDRCFSSQKCDSDFRLTKVEVYPN